MKKDCTVVLNMLMTVYGTYASISDRAGLLVRSNSNNSKYHGMLREQILQLRDVESAGYTVDKSGYTWAFFPLRGADSDRLLVLGPVSVMSFYVRFNTAAHTEGINIPVHSWDVLKTMLKAVVYELYGEAFNVEPINGEKDFDGLMSEDEYYDSHRDVSEKLTCAVRFLHFATECIKVGNYDDLYMLVMDDAFIGFVTMLMELSRARTLDFFAFAAAQCSTAASDEALSLETIEIYAKYMTMVKASNNSEEIVQCLRKMLLEFVSYSREHREFSGKSSSVREVLKIINSSIEENISIADIAESIHVSQGHLMRLFKQEFGITLTDYINRKKLERACMYLKFFDYSVADISQKLSFCNQSYFSSCFKKTYGVTPVEYRRQVSCCITEK